MEAIQPIQSSSSSSLHQQNDNHNQNQQQIQPSDSDPTAGELRALDCNLASLCDHVQIEGFNSGAFSDVIVEAMGSTYPLHRLILSRSSYFRNMLHGPWKEAGAPTIVLSIDDANVNSKAIEMALAYLYGYHPKLNDDNAFRVLAAASFLDLQDLCAICTDFIISELWTSNFLAYQVFAEGQDYGIHGERVKNACWGYLCQSGTLELREVLPKLSSQTLHALLTSDELWVSNEEKRIEFDEVHRLADGQVKHSPEVFYAGSLWKVSVQAFNDEDPQGRRTLGLFLHRRKAEMNDLFRKIHMYVDTREKVTARYQLICPSKREVMVFGSFKQAGTQLPKAPKGWGWRTALLFDELGELLQGGTLRIAAVVQLV